MRTGCRAPLLSAVILRGAPASADCGSCPACGRCDCSSRADWRLGCTSTPPVRGLRGVAFPRSGRHAPGARSAALWGWRPLRRLLRSPAQSGSPRPHGAPGRVRRPGRDRAEATRTGRILRPCHGPQRASRAARGGVAALLSAPKPQKTPASCEPNKLSPPISTVEHNFGAGERPRKERESPTTTFERSTLLERRNTFLDNYFSKDGEAL